MRKKYLILFLVALVMIGGCKWSETEEDDKTLTVTILPQKYITEKIAGDFYDINVMIPPGANPATYEPTPRQIGKLNRSDAYLKIGHITFEKAWMKKIKSAAPDLKIYDSSKGLDFISNNERIDPHIWTSPEMVAEMAKNLKDILTELTPEKEKVFAENLKKFEKEIHDMQRTIHQKLEPYSGKSFLIYHPALAYYCREFDLKQIPIEAEGKEPSASYMQKIIEKSEQKNIRAIFIQKQFDQKKALTLAQELDAEVISINPLAENWKKSIMSITNKIAESFKISNHESG